MRIQIRFLIAIAAIGLSVSPALSLKVLLRAETTVKQTMSAEIVVTGKVVEIEKEVVHARLHSGSTVKTPYQIALVKINENLIGGKGLTHIRVGFIPTTNSRNDEDVTIERGEHCHNLIEGFEGCFFVMKHLEEDFYIQRHNGQALSKGQKNYEQEIFKVRKIANALADPIKALTAKEATDRQYAAITLLQKYRTHPDYADKKAIREEAVHAEVSNLILQTFGGLEWNKADANGASAENAFWLLELKAEHGWVPPAPPADNAAFNKAYTLAFANWVKDHGSKYTLRRYVVDRTKN